MDLNSQQKTSTTSLIVESNNNYTSYENLCKSKVTERLSVLNNTVKRVDLELHDIEIHENCPSSVAKYIQSKLEWTIPVLNKQLPNSPCWKYLGAKDKSGYARHNPKSNKLPLEAQKCSRLLYRFIYRWLYMPEGIPRYTSKGELYEIDHKCGKGTNRCINPWHTQLIPRKLNQQLGDHSDY